MDADWQVGDEVVLRHTGAIAYIEEILDEDSVLVELDGDFIPVDIEDLLDPSELNAEFAPASDQQRSASNSPGDSSSDHQVLALNDLQEGLSLCFSQQSEQMDKGILVRLINLTEHSWMGELEGPSGRKRFLLDSGDQIEVAQLNLDQFNEAPRFLIKGSRKNDSGTDYPFEEKLKIKVSSFMRQMHSSSQSQVQMLIFRDLPKRKQSWDLPQHKVSRQSHRKPAAYFSPDSIFGSQFPNSIDLHAEALIKSGKHKVPKDPSKLLPFQLQVARSYLEQALALNLSPVYLIHGIGEGVLREALHRELKTWPEVSGYRNEYHPRYGFGATEVFFDH
jgi:hypothetical protein